jgi:calcium-dependent protein kinase
MAPETLRSEVYPASDVWAAGVMAHQLLTGRFPFDDRSNPFAPSLSKVWASILADELDLGRSHWQGISEEAKDFVRLLLNKVGVVVCV